MAGYLSIPIATVVKLSLKVPHRENGSDFIFSVCRVFSETGRKKVKLTITSWHPRGPAGQANVSRPPEGRLGTLLSKALASTLAGPCSSTCNCASKSVYFKTFALGRPPCASHAFHGNERQSTPWPQDRTLLQVSSSIPLSIHLFPLSVLPSTVRLSPVSVK